ncbi:MAG TPA: serine O-acetyltransferase [Rhodocyclaceae bacterium]|jgi:serine O-acetyltransferase|nr:serine O-acetyltransferase [Rhodocyclaceae bacterium]HNE41756.1 serine O-acetyltransferase [Rhodocyclaceae bacterium]HNM81193.1 serine O-acetyltransferase [Rhodocyclaceae bacterium]
MPEAAAMPLPNAAIPTLLTLVREDVRCVFARDPAARSLFEVAATYPGVHAIVAHRFAFRLWQAGWRFTARFLAFLARALTNVDIHPGATIGRRFFIDHGAGVVIGETAEIGNDVTLYHGVTLGGTSWNKGKRHPTLADGVVVGAGAKILGPIRIGERVRVGANSVVVKEVPADRTVVGVPGRIVDTRAGTGRPEDGISLDHNLLPDPVAKSIACLIERIETLESELAVLRHGEPPPAHDGRCLVCSAGDLCCESAEMHASPSIPCDSVT